MRKMKPINKAQGSDKYLCAGPHRLIKQSVCMLHPQLKKRKPQMRIDINRQLLKLYI